MPNNNTFIGDFKSRLDAIPESYTLAEWEYLYRSVIFAVGMKILETFPQAAVGPIPPEAGPVATSNAQTGPGNMQPIRPMTGGGPTGGGHPHIICFVEFVLGLDPEPPN